MILRLQKLKRYYWRIDVWWLCERERDATCWNIFICSLVARQRKVCLHRNFARNLSGAISQSPSVRRHWTPNTGHGRTCSVNRHNWGCRRGWRRWGGALGTISSSYWVFVTSRSDLADEGVYCVSWDERHDDDGTSSRKSSILVVFLLCLTLIETGVRMKVMVCSVRCLWSRDRVNKCIYEYISL